MLPKTIGVYGICSVISRACFFTKQFHNLDPSNKTFGVVLSYKDGPRFLWII